VKEKNKQTEAHDWLGDAAESLVRYYFAKRGFYAYGSGKWGVDCVLQNKESGKMLTIEVKSTDTNKSSRDLLKSLKKKLEKFGPDLRPDMYAEVRVKSRSGGSLESKGNNVVSLKIAISLWDIDKKEMSLVEYGSISGAHL